LRITYPRTNNQNIVPTIAFTDLVANITTKNKHNRFKDQKDDSDSDRLRIEWGHVENGWCRAKIRDIIPDLKSKNWASQKNVE
jgi:hypothetical protein